MFKKFTNGAVHIVQRFLPDAFIFCIILTIIIWIVCMPAAGVGPLQAIIGWGSGVWNLLAFSMQMALVLVLGNAFATAPAVKRFIVRIAKVPKTPASAIFFVTAISTICCFLQWGFGLVVGALLAKEVARNMKGVDYRLLIASAYSGFVVWHAGISGSIPLQVADISWTTSIRLPESYVGEAIPTSETIFAPWNLITCLVVLVAISFACMKMHPAPEDVVEVDASKLVQEDFGSKRVASTPAEKMEDSPILSGFIWVCGIIYLIYYFKSNGFNLSLNIVNFIFLILGIAFHVRPISYVHAIDDAVKGAGGIILQFPFYSGIMALMTLGGGSTGTNLAAIISDFFVTISNKITFPLFTFLSAGIVNFFVPSGGGQWTVQGPIVMPAAQTLGVPAGVAAMAIAWGDAWTNMLQPFWALPALGIAGLGARDIMGYCAIVLIISGLIVGVLGFLILVPNMAAGY
ncbi:MAG: TIGR00366 family protein [Lachnospiraceae bacterium]|nr:TIGR00366 family protein [Lachnospiraceae bacterium]